MSVEELARFEVLVILEPVIEDFMDFLRIVKLRILLVLKVDLVDIDFLDVLQNLFSVFDTMLLDSHTLCIDSTRLSLVLSLLPELPVLLL